MRQTLIAGLILFAAVVPCNGQTVSRSGRGPDPAAGDWIGGLDFGNSWQAIRMHFEVAAKGSANPNEPGDSLVQLR